MGILEEIGSAKTRQDLAGLWDRYYPQGRWTDGLTSAAEVRLREIEAPDCKMCTRSARWLNTRMEYANYCGGSSCTNRDRKCQGCGEPFTIGVDGAGTKYCSTGCKARGYHPTTSRAAVLCAWGGEPNPAPFRARAGVWPYICERCLDPIKHIVDRLKAHHVPHERAQQLLVDPYCESCRVVDVVVKVDAGHGKRRSLLVVDHDHGHCPADTHSCGQCVRGLICHGCNVSAGFLRDSPESARRLAAYLERWAVTQRVGGSE